MAPFPLQLNLSPSRYSAFNFTSMSRASNCHCRAVRSPGIVSNASLSPITLSPKRKARSTASASVFTSLINALKLKPKGKKPAQILLGPVCSGAPLSPIVKRHYKPGLRRARSVPAIGRKQITRYKRTASSGDDMDVDSDEEDIGEEVGPTQYLYYDASEDPFATPPGPCTPGAPLSPMMLDNDAETPASSPDGTKNRKKRAVERSKMKTLQLLGPEACMAINKQYGDT